MRKFGKKSMVGGVLALTLILTGTGYAYWSDTLNITTTATTSDFDVTFVDLGLYAQYTNETSSTDWSIVDGIGTDGYVGSTVFARGTGDYNSSTNGYDYSTRSNGYNNVDFAASLVDADWITADIKGAYNHTNTKGSDQINININEMYPGYAQAFRTDIINQGSIAAVLSDIKFDVTNVNDTELSDEAKSLLGLAVYVDKESYNNADSSDNYNGKQVFTLCDSLSDVGLTSDDFFTVGDVDFVRLSALDGLTETQLADLTSLITEDQLLCKPTDNRMDLFMAVAMDPDATGQFTTGNSGLLYTKTTNANADTVDTYSENNGATISINLLWDQFNAGTDAGDGNVLTNQNVTAQ